MVDMIRANTRKIAKNFMMQSFEDVVNCDEKLKIGRSCSAGQLMIFNGKQSPFISFPEVA
jgi:hypothetical protein